MFPTLFENAYIIVPTWHLFFILSIVCTFRTYLYLNLKLNPHFSRKQLKIVLILVYIWSYIGARLSSIQTETNSFSLFDLIKLLIDSGPLCFHGGFAYSAVCLLFYLKITKQNIRQHLDIGVPSCLLGLSIIKIGCFFNGDDYGYHVIYHGTAPWWAVTFPNHIEPTPRYPTQLFESFASFTLFTILFFNFKTLTQRLPMGYVGLLGIIFYEIVRFFNDYYRDESKLWIIQHQLSTSQGVNLIVIIFTLFLCKKKQFYQNSGYD